MELFENLIDFISAKSQTTDVFEASSYSGNLQELQVAEWFESVGRRCVTIKCGDLLFVVYMIEDEWGWSAKFRRIEHMC
jgi:hypothetical protein